jgi:hypothetical protein
MFRVYFTGPMPARDQRRVLGQLFGIMASNSLTDTRGSQPS